MNNNGPSTDPCGIPLETLPHMSYDTLLYSFNSVCLPAYGLEMWDSYTVFSKQIFKTFEVAYNNALERICAAPVSTSSHLIANFLNQFLLKHHYCLIFARFYIRILHSVYGF